MNYYPFHIGDYTAATAHLSALEDIAYRRMLDRYYAHERPLPADREVLCRLIRMQSDDERQAVETVIQEFFTTQAGHLQNTRAETEVCKYRNLVKKATAAISARWKRKKTDTNVSSTYYQPEPEPEPDKRTPLPPKGKPRKRGGFDASAVELPPWLPRELWQQWCKDRVDRKKPITEAGAKQQLADLARWQEDGLDAAAAITASINGGWQGLFPPRKANGNGHHHPKSATMEDQEIPY